MKRHVTHFFPDSDRSTASMHLAGKTKGICATSPSESVIRNLLNYSKALAVLKTENTGYLNLVMN